MVRTLRAAALCCTLAALLAQPLAASAADYAPYDGNISTTYTTIFRDIAGKVSPLYDYVFFRSGQYEYMLVSGDLTLESGTFSAESCTVTRIITSTGSSSYSFSQREESDLTLTVEDALVYSNLGHYPDLIERNSFYSFCCVVLGLIALIMYLVRSIFSFSLRRR